MLFLCCFLYDAGFSFLIPGQSILNYLSFFLSQFVHLAISQLASSLNLFPILVLLYCEIFIYFYLLDLVGRHEL